MRLTRRDLLLGTAAMGLAACGPKTPQPRALELWTLQLAPKFNPYLADVLGACLLYTSPSPRDRQKSRMPSSA